MQTKRKGAPQPKQRCAEVAQRHPGWIVWVAGTGTPVATRSGNPKPPQNADASGWALTLIGEGTNPWTDLERQLAEQP